MTLKEKMMLALNEASRDPNTVVAIMDDIWPATELALKGIIIMQKDIYIRLCAEGNRPDLAFEDSVVATTYMIQHQQTAEKRVMDALAEVMTEDWDDIKHSGQ